MRQYNDLLHTLHSVVVYMCTDRFASTKHYISQGHADTSFWFSQLAATARTSYSRLVVLTEPE